MLRLLRIQKSKTIYLFPALLQGRGDYSPIPETGHWLTLRVRMEGEDPPADEQKKQIRNYAGIEEAFSDYNN